LFATIGTAIFVYHIAKENGYKSREEEVIKLQCEVQELRNQIAKELKQQSSQETSPTDRSGVKPDGIVESLNSLINKLTKGKGDQSGGFR
jgi:hypothetical protein